MGMRAQQPKAPLPEFEKIRAQTQQRFAAQGQQQGDALQRRMASIGNLKSGAAFKQQQNLQNDLGQQREQALGQVDVQEAGEAQRRQEVQDTRDFAAKESQLGRDLASQEAQVGRDFAGSESALGRALQSGQFDKSFGLQQGAFDSAEKQTAFTNKMATDEAKQNKRMTNFNMATALGGAGKAQGAILDYFNKLEPGSKKLNLGGAMARASGGGAQNPLIDPLSGRRYINPALGAGGGLYR
jgi:hypothetical protein